MTSENDKGKNPKEKRDWPDTIIMWSVICFVLFIFGCLGWMFYHMARLFG